MKRRPRFPSQCLADAIGRSFERLEERLDAAESRIYSR
jgi:hypothetical protein